MTFAQPGVEMPPHPETAERDVFKSRPYTAVGKSATVRELPKQMLQPVTGELDPAFNPVLDFAHGFAFAVETQPDGKMLVGGGFKSVNGFVSSGLIRLNVDRSLDMGFSVTVRGIVYALAVQPDGKIVIVGSFYAVNGVARNSIVRLNADGSLDPSFDTGSGPDASVLDVILQTDGKVLIAGQFFSVNGFSSRGMARLNSDGAVDTTFTSPAIPSPSGGVSVSGIEVQPDGKIIFVGAMTVMQGGVSQARFCVRLNADGSLDPSFSTPSISSNPYAVALQPDGKILISGFFVTINGVNRNRIARLNSNGTLDQTFNPGSGANSSVLFIRVQTNGKILIGGSFASINGVVRGRVAQLNADGSLDESFSPSGIASGSVRTVMPISGGYYIGGNFTRLSGSNRDTLVVLNGDGSLDASFNATSLQVASLDALTVQSDGKILVGGFFNRFNETVSNSLVRLNPNGSLDSTFGIGTPITGLVEQLILQPDGKILVVGAFISINGGPSVTMVRLNADGTQDNSFTLTSTPQAFEGFAAAMQPDGRIIFSYGTNSTNPATNSGIVRLNPDGSLDPSFSSLSLRFEAITVLPNAQILAAGPFAFGYVSSGSGFEAHNGIVRLNSDGSHDRSFRSGLVSETPNITAVYSMRPQPDGKILLGGTLFTGIATAPVGVVRLNSTGTIDGTFQTNVISSLFGGPLVYSIHPTSDGNILVGGFFSNYGGFSRNNVIRLESNGSVDQTFAAGTDDVVNVVTTQLSGAVLIGGSFSKVNGIPRTALARLLIEPSNQYRAPFDFDGDNKTDIGIYRPGPGEWWYRRSSDGAVPILQFGAATDRIAPADFTGDGKTDIAFFRPSSGQWFILRSEDNSYFAFPFGTNGDVPVPADYDGDGKADPAVFRPSDSTWIILRSGDGGVTFQQFGQTGDVPVTADYDGDDRSDIAIYRPNLGQWWISRSTLGAMVLQFGEATDKAVPADYTGDGKADVAFWRPSTGFWYILRSENFSFFAFPFGQTGDVPVPGDYDGDGTSDPAVFRPSDGLWFALRSTAGTSIQQFGLSSDQPIPSAFVP